METLLAGLQLLQVQAKVLLAIRKIRHAHQFDRLLRGVNVLLIRMVHRNFCKGRLLREHQVIVEGILGVDVVAEQNVCYLEGQQRVEVALLFRLLTIRGGNRRRIQQALGYQDRVADRQGLQRLRKQRTHLQGTIYRNLVVRKNIVGQQLEGLVEVAGSVDQAGLVQAVNDIVLGLLHPLALRLQRAHIRSIRGSVGRALHLKRRLVSFLRRNLQRVAPDVVHSLELQGVARALGIGFFDVYRSRKPQALLHVGPPRIEVIELADILL